MRSKVGSPRRKPDLQIAERHWTNRARNKNLDSIAAAEAAEEAQKNSWKIWVLSPMYKKAEDTEEEKAREDRERQERRIEKDMKERRLDAKVEDLKKEECLLKRAEVDVHAADRNDTEKIREIQDRIWAREARERQERERLEGKRRAKLEKQQQELRERRSQEAAEALRKQRAENRAAEARNRWNTPCAAEGKARQGFTSTCRHNGWWPKVQGRTTCPEGRQYWTYLLQCPTCDVTACPNVRGLYGQGYRAIRQNPSEEISQGNLQTPSFSVMTSRLGKAEVMKRTKGNEWTRRRRRERGEGTKAGRV